MAKPYTVATYAKNVAKSIGYSVIDEIKNSNPAIRGFAETNADVMKDTYHAITHMKQTVSSLSQSVLDSKAGALGKQAISNIKEDLKTGKFYNMERKQKSESAAAKSWMSDGEDFDDFDFEGLANGSIDSGGGDDDEDVSLEDMMDLVGKKSSEAVSDTIVRTAEYSAQVQTDLARASAEQAQSIYAHLHSGMGTINENISKMIEIANGPLTDHMQNSQKYYESESALSQERNDLLKQILEIQKGIYSKNGKDYSKDRITMSQIMDEGMPDLDTYFQAIKKNLEDTSGGMLDLFKDYLENGMLDTIIASPLEGITNVIAKTIIPKTLTEAMKTFNKSLSGAFSSVMSQLMNSDSDNGIINFIKNIFGISDYTKTSISTSRYEKGAVPFDGIVKKSIVEVIPTYLARIESAITKTTERRYDYEYGKFVDVDKIKGNFNDIENQASRRAGSDITNYLDKYMGVIDFGEDKKRKKSLQKNIERLMKTSFKRGVIFNPKDFDGMASDMGLKGKHADDDFEIIRRMFEAIPKDVLLGYAREMYSAKDQMSRRIQMMEESGHDVSNALFNNSLDNTTVSGGKKKKKKSKTNSSSLQDSVEDSGQTKEKKDKKKKKKDKSDDDDDSSSDDKGNRTLSGQLANTTGNLTGNRNKKKIKYDPDDLESILENATDIFREENVLKTDKDKKTLMQRFKASEKISDGIKKFVGKMDELLHKPTEFLAGFIRKADTALYKMIFGVEYDEDGERKSVAKAIFDGLKDNFNHFKDWLDRKILDPIMAYFDKEGTLGNKVKNWAKGRIDGFKQSNFGSRFFKATSGAADYVKGTVTDAAKAVGKAAEEGLGVKETEAANAADALRDAVKDQAADGIKKIRKTGLMAVSEGEMVIPPDMNPFNIDKRIKKENAAKKKFANAFINSIPNYGGGTVNVEGVDIDVDTANKAIADNWKSKLSDGSGIGDFTKLPKEIQERILGALDNEHSKIVADKIHERISSITALIGDSVGRGRGKEKDIKSQEDTLVEITTKEVKKFAPEVAAGSLIGTGIVGLISGPLIGAALGGAVALAKNSEVFSEKLFGKIAQSGDEKGKRQGGLFNKEMAQAIQKYAPAMLKGSTIGAITSLLPFVPGGPIAGILAGSAIGFASQNDDIRERLFGEEGLLGKNFDTKFKQSLPALGAGAAVGYLTGPFGTVTNILLGSALGWASTTETVKDFIFGEPDEKGKRHGGLVENVVKDIFNPIAEFTRNTMVDLIEWSKENIKRPLADAVDPLRKQFSLMGRGIMDGINKLFEEKLGATLDSLIKDRIISPVGTFLKKAMGLALFPIKAIVKAPFSVIGAVGDSLRNRQINRGNAEYMSADQRLAFREQGGLLRKLNITRRSERWNQYDEALSNMSGEEAEGLASKLSFALDKEKTLEESNNKAHEIFTNKVRNNRKLSSGNVNMIARTIKGYVKKEKDLEKASQKAQIYISTIRGLTDRERDEISQAVDEYLASIASFRQTSSEFGDNKQKLIEALKESNTFKEAGIENIKEEDLPKLLRYLEAEAKYKTVTADGEAIHSDKLAGDLPSLNEEQEKRHKETMDVLDEINKNLAALTKPSESETARIYARLRENWDDNRTSGEQLAYIRDTILETAGNVRDGVRQIGGDVVRGGTHIKESLVGRRGDDWRTPRDIPSHATGIRVVPETGIAAISKGELIIPPDLNPFNIDKRKKDEEKVKKNFMDSIPGFAEGGQLGDDDESFDPTKKNSIFDSFINKAKRRVKIVFDQAGRQYKYREDDEGELIMDTSDSETVKSLNEANKEKEEKKSLLNSIVGFPNAIAEKFGKLFNGDEEDKKNKKGILGKLFSMLGGGKDGSSGIIGKSIASVVGIPILTSLLKKFFGETELGQAIGEKFTSVMDGLNLSDKFTNVVDGIVNWLSGGPNAIGGGLPGLLVAAASHWATGFEFIATTIAPKAIEILIKALPGMLLGVVRGIGAIITENFHNMLHGGEGSNGLVQADKDLVKYSAGSTLSDLLKPNSDGNASLVFNGKTYSASNTFAQIAGKGGGTIDIPDISSGIIGAANKNIKLVAPGKETDEQIKQANDAYDEGLKNGSISDYKNTDSYKDLSKGMRTKLDEQLLQLEKEGKNVIQINTGTDENPNYEYKTLQELLASDTSVFTYQGDNGQMHNLTGMDILNNPTIGSQYGLNWQLTDEERQKIKEDQGLAADSSIQGSVARMGIKKFLTGDSTKTGLSTIGKIAGHVPIIGKPIQAALAGGDAVARGLGKAGSAIGGGGSLQVKVTEGAASLVEKAGSALAGGGDLVRTTNSAAGELMSRSEAVAKGLSEEMGEFTVEQSSKLGKLGEKLGINKVGQEAMEQTAKNAAEGESKGLVKKIVKWVTSHLKDIIGNNKVFEFVAKGLRKAGKNCSKEGVEKALQVILKAIEKQAMPKFVKALESAGAKIIAKFAGKVFSGGIVGLIFSGAAFMNAYNNSKTVLGVVDDESIDYDPTFTTRLLCGLAGFLNETFFNSLVGLDTIFNIIYEPAKELFGLSEEDTAELDKARADSQKFMKENNMENDTNMTIQEYNDKDKLSTKLKNGFSSVVDSAKKGITGLFGGYDDIGDKEGQEIVDKYNAKHGTKFTVDDLRNGKVYTSLSTALSNAGKGITKWAKNTGSNIVSGAKSAGKTILEAGSILTDAAKNAFDYAMYRSDKNAADTVEGSADKEDPTYGFARIISNTMDIVFTPLRGVVTVGRGIADIGRNIADFVSKFVDQVRSDAAQGAKDFENGDFKSYFSFGSTEVDAEGNASKNPLSPIRVIIKTATRMLQLPVLGVRYAGQQVAKGIGTLIDGARNIAGKILNSASETIDIARNGSIIDYFKIVKNKEDGGFSWLDTAITGVTRYFMAPIALGVGAFTRITRFIRSVIDGVRSIGTAAIGEAGNVIDMARTGSLQGYFNIVTNNDDGSVNWMDTILKGATRYVMAPVALSVAGFTQVSKFVRTLIDGVRSIGTAAIGEAGNVIDMARTGSLQGYFNIVTNNDDGSVNWMDTILKGATRYVMAPVALGVAAFTRVSDFIRSVIDGARAIGSMIPSKASETMRLARTGSLQGYFSVVSNNSDGTINWMDTVITGATRVALSPVATVVAAMTNIKKGITSILESGKTTLSNITKDAEYVAGYHGKTSLDGYWTSNQKKSDGVFGVIETIIQSMNRVIQFPFIVIRQALNGAVDMVSKPIDWVKDKLGGVGKAVQNFFGFGGDGDTTGLGDGGSGSGLKGFSGRGSNSTSGSSSDDPSFISQLDNKYASKSFNVSGDTDKQTIADTGCGPAAAAMVVNNAYQQDELSMNDAAKHALKYKIKNGGVNAAYFENEFSRHGLATSYIMDENPEDKNANIVRNLRSGNRTVLMGKDPSNKSKADSPYGPDDHYIVATRISDDGKYMWVNDPESKTPETKYLTSTILNNTRMGVAGIAASGSGIKSLINKASRFSARGTIPGKDVPEQCWNYFKSHGYSDEAACGMMGNFMQESGMNPACNVRAAGGLYMLEKATGFYDKYCQYARSRGCDWTDVGCQLDWLEQTIPESFQHYTGKKPYYYSTGEWCWWPEKMTLEQFKKLTDLEKATEIFERVYERGSITRMDKRIAFAKEFYARFKGKPYTNVGGETSGGDGSSSSESGSTGGTILDKIFGVFDDLSAAYGLKSKSSSSEGGESSDGSTGGTSGGSDKQKALVDKMKSVQGKLKYSQVNRNPDTGSGDCSSTVQWAYKNVLNVDPGSWTGAQETDSDLYTVTDNANDTSKLQPGDLLLYRRGGQSTHVEMYAGDGQMIGHGGGMGPKLRPVQHTLGSQSVAMVRRWTGFKGGSGSGLYVARGTGLDPQKDMSLNDTAKTPFRHQQDKYGFLKKSRYDSSMNKDVKIPAGMFAAGSEMDEVKSTPAKAPGKIEFRHPEDTKVEINDNRKTISDKVTTYLNAILKLLAKEVENTSMLSTIVTILTELVKTYEEERAIDKTSSNAEQQRSMLESKRMSMMNILKATGIQSSGNNELSRLMADAERLAKI